GREVRHRHRCRRAFPARSRGDRRRWCTGPVRRRLGPPARVEHTARAGAPLRGGQSGAPGRDPRDDGTLAARARRSNLGMLRRPARLALYGAVALLFVLLIGRAAAELYTEVLWFQDVGYASAFWTRIRAILTVRFATGVLGGAIVLVNLWTVARHLG